MDVHDKKTRSYNMSRIRSSGTKPEMRVLEVCRHLKRRYFRNRKALPGKPDLVFPKGRIAVFVHGCFWHSHNCPNGTKKPAQNALFWEKKRQETVERDFRQKHRLEELGYEVHTIWECETKNPIHIKNVLQNILGIKA